MNIISLIKRKLGLPYPELLPHLKQGIAQLNLLKHNEYRKKIWEQRYNKLRNEKYPFNQVGNMEYMNDHWMSVLSIMKEFEKTLMYKYFKYEMCITDNDFNQITFYLFNTKSEDRFHVVLSHFDVQRFFEACNKITGFNFDVFYYLLEERMLEKKPPKGEK